MSNSVTRQVRWFILCAVACILCLNGAVHSAAAQEGLSREDALQADLAEAVEMLEKNQDELLVYDFLPMEVERDFRQLNDPRRGRPASGGRGIEQLPDRLRTLLIGQLKAAQTGKITWNRDKSLAWVHYTTEQMEVTPAKPPGFVPEDAEAEIPAGLGSEVEDVLNESLDLLKSKQKPALRQFLLGMLPAQEAAKLQSDDAMQRMLSRLNQHPEMIDAMVRDLTAAKRGAPHTSGDHAVIAERGADMKTELQKVAGSWRLVGFTPAQQAEYRKLVNSEIEASIIPAQRGTLVLTYTESRWRLMAMPTQFSKQ